MSLKVSTNSMAKKSPLPDRRRALAAAAFWVARMNPVVLIGLGALLLALVVLAGLRPVPPEQQRGESAERQAEYDRQEKRLLAQAHAMPATGRLNLSFEKLNFYLPPDAPRPFVDGRGVGPYLPAGIKSYNGRDVRIQGYMLPTRLEGGLVKECLILANQMSCCFGQDPRFCEFIVAQIDGAGVPDQMDEPLQFEGRLQVGDVFVGGTWVALYSMNGTTVSR